MFAVIIYTSDSNIIYIVINWVRVIRLKINVKFNYIETAKIQQLLYKI